MKTKHACPPSCVVYLNGESLRQMLRRANLRTQRSELRVLQVDPIVVEVCLGEVAQYVTPSTGSMARSLWLLSQARDPNLQAESILGEFCNHVQILKRGQNLSAVYHLPDGSQYQLKLRSTTLNEVVACIQDLAVIAEEDMRSRFANLGITKFFVHCRRHLPGASGRSRGAGWGGQKCPTGASHCSHGQALRAALWRAAWAGSAPPPREGSVLPG